VASSGAAVPPSVGLSIIRGPQLEARALRSVLPGADVRTDDVPDVLVLLGMIAEYGTVHLAGHAHANRNELASGLWIGGPTPAAAYLSGAAVLAGPPLHDVSLVVLSGCETALHPVGGIAVQAWRGLDMAFLARGARAVISSLWPIHDFLAVVWAVTFHTERAAGVNVARAVKLAADAIRTGRISDTARGVLDHSMPTWADSLAAAGSDQPFAWAAWRASGLCW
jgi:CHAT domain-containing protein